MEDTLKIQKALQKAGIDYNNDPKTDECINLFDSVKARIYEIDNEIKKLDEDVKNMMKNLGYDNYEDFTNDKKSYNLNYNAEFEDELPENYIQSIKAKLYDINIKIQKSYKELEILGEKLKGLYPNLPIEK